MITPTKWIDMKSLDKQGLSKSEISKRLGVSRQTVYNNISKSHTPKYVRLPSKSKLDEFKSYIDKRLNEYNLSATRLYDEVKHNGYTGRYSLLASYVKEKKKSLKNSAVMRFETMPGEQSQVDWGFMGEIFDSNLKKTINICCFVIILGYSRMRYIRFYSDAKTDNFLDGHNRAFEYFGGYTNDILYDNLKSVVIKRALISKESEFNKRFIDFSGYYGFKTILCRPYKPCTKGKVEKSVDYVKSNFYRGREWRSLDEINNCSLQWLEKINSQIHLTTHEAPTARLKRENLNKIPNQMLYDLTVIFYRKIFSDCHFSYFGNRYSVPYEYAGKEVSATVKNEIITVIYREKVIASHQLREPFQHIYVTDKNHLKGLLDLRKNSFIRKPFRKEKVFKKVQEFNPCINFKTDAIVEERTLDYYERIESYE